MNLEDEGKCFRGGQIFPWNRIQLSISGVHVLFSIKWYKVLPDMTFSRSKHVNTIVTQDNRRMAEKAKTEWQGILDAIEKEDTICCKMSLLAFICHTLKHVICVVWWMVLKGEIEVWTIYGEMNLLKKIDLIFIIISLSHNAQSIAYLE